MGMGMGAGVGVGVGMGMRAGTAWALLRGAPPWFRVRVGVAKRVVPTTSTSTTDCCPSFSHFARRSSSSSSALRARGHCRPRRPFARKTDANANDNEKEEITRAKEILGVVEVEAERQQKKDKSAFEEWLDEKLATKEPAQNSDGNANWVQVDKARRKFYEKRRKRMYGPDSEDEKQEEDKYVELKPEIVEFPSFHAKQEELYFYDAFCFPWEKDQHYRLIRKLEQKYYPHQGLENALIDPYQPSKVHTAKVTKEAEGEAATLRKTKVASILRDERGRTSAGNSKRLETKPKGDAVPKRISSESGNHPTAQIDLNPNDIGHGLSQKKVQEFLKSLKHAPKFDGPADLPYFLTKKSELPARWDGPLGTVVLVDKPKGWTSFTVCGKLRRMVKVEKVGHAGTLDPMATGLLIVCVGKATKQVQSFQDMIKVYSGVFRLGEATSTWDADSPVIEREPWEHVKDDDIQKAVTSFFGEIWQVPPMFSAIKVGGEKMYDKARKGETINLPPRRVLIYDFHVERSLDDRQNLIFKVTCSKGTYVRSLCADFGRALGSCAHLTTLRRERIGDYSVADAWKFSELEDEIVKHYI